MITISNIPFNKFRASKYQISKTNKGFTLIELLIVVAIIGVLSSFLMANFVGIRQRGRDGQRKSDLRQIQSALEMYRADQGSYPTVNASPYNINSTVCPTSSSLINGSATYMQQIPCDPLGTSVYNSGNYYYYSDGTTYVLAACLENTNDSQGTSSAPAPSGGTCSSNFYYVLNNP